MADGFYRCSDTQKPICDIQTLLQIGRSWTHTHTHTFTEKAERRLRMDKAMEVEAREGEMDIAASDFTSDILTRHTKAQHTK